MDMINMIPFIIFGWLFLCGIIIVLCWILTIIRFFKLERYLKSHNYQKWRELSSIGRFGPGLSNPLRAWAYVFSNEVERDENLLRLKDAARISLRYSLVWFGTFLLSLILGAITMATFSFY